MLDVELSIRDVDGRAVVALRGELNLADTPGVTSHLIAAVAACGPSAIVDMTGLDGIGDGALPVLLRVLQWTRRSGGDLPLVAPHRPVRQVLEATGLIDVFSVYPTVEEAANSPGPARPRSEPAGAAHVQAGVAQSRTAPSALPVARSLPSWLDATA